jgi:uncharacterized protein DUF3857/transglutaminase superfamily protein
MKNRLFCNRVRQARTTKRGLGQVMLGAAVVLAQAAVAGDAPQWMHALVNVPLPAHDEKTNAVLLYSEKNVTVVSADKIKTVMRQAYRILRPSGRDQGTIVVYLDPRRKVNSLHGWCIPADGKDYEVKDKDALEASPPKTEGGELVSNLKVKILRVPAPDPGNIVGYEYELEEQPLVLQDVWAFQEDVPARESHFSLQLPSGWEYKSTWLNYPEVGASPAGSGAWKWVVSDVKEIQKEEEDMPPMAGVAGRMVVSYFPPGGAATRGFANWQEMGQWYRNLIAGRRETTPEIKQKVAALTSSAPTPLAKMKAIAQFVQHDIRYVAIELGIGGWQPHPAADVFVNRYGDCKDKATLMAAMLHEIGVDSYYVVINTTRGGVTPGTPAYVGEFNHVVLGIKLPEGVSDSSLVATIQHFRLGKILFFDPTNELTPFGQIGGYLQANYGLLVSPDVGELVELPEQSASMNSISRIGKLALEETGTLKGEVQEVRVGDRAWSQRWALRTVSKDADRIKPIEALLAGSIADFNITSAKVINVDRSDMPFGFNYSFEARNYAKNAGGLLFVRPRVVGSKTRSLMETKEPRKFPIEFEGPAMDTDRFEITLPPGYEVDDLPPPVDADYGFASYHAKTEAKGNVVIYTRTFEVKQLSVPVSQAAELKRFYRMIASDERNTAVLKPITK